MDPRPAARLRPPLVRCRRLSRRLSRRRLRRQRDQLTIQQSYDFTSIGAIFAATDIVCMLLDQLSQDNWSSVLFKMGGGIVLSLGNLATQCAWAFVGLSVTQERR
ncbi:ureide permease 4-like isoform X2 [Salvia miltiorrhiza]|uniref:ureide permease 4-like isoform X2 n=1 Tax=Salvia miltiorrhiza TaxID=226208 RepID=UPI0025AD39FF|nr:ureide permease 4-like isoform X2 [Salvia miltiorrhiza]